MSVLSFLVLLLEMDLVLCVRVEQPSLVMLVKERLSQSTTNGFVLEILPGIDFLRLTPGPLLYLRDGCFLNRHVLWESMIYQKGF